MCGLDTQESILATKVSNLRNKSHLYSKMTTFVSNCPNFIATGVPICADGQTDGQTQTNMPKKFFEVGDKKTEVLEPVICTSNT